MKEMKYRNYLLPAICGIICLAFFACDKETEPLAQTYYMDKDFTENNYFQSGSLWVYSKDSSTKDTVRVISSQYSLKDSADFSWQVLASQYSSSYDRDTVVLKSGFIKSSSTFYITETKGNNEVLHFFSLKPPGYVLDLSPSLKMRYRDVKDTSVNGELYSAVRIFENLGPGTNLRQAKELWFARNAGLVRKELFNGEVWTLDSLSVQQ